MKKKLLGETVGLFFFTTACWTIPPVFATLTTVPSLMLRVKVGRMFSRDFCEEEQHPGEEFDSAHE